MHSYYRNICLEERKRVSLNFHDFSIISPPKLTLTYADFLFFVEVTTDSMAKGGKATAAKADKAGKETVIEEPGADQLRVGITGNETTAELVALGLMGANDNANELVVGVNGNTIEFKDTVLPSIVAVVTPQKLAVARESTGSPVETAVAKDLPPGDQGRQFYIINKETHGYMKQESKEIAMEYYEAMRNVSKELADNLVVQDFASDAHMTAFIDALIKMSGKKPANPMATVAHNVAVMHPMAGLAAVAPNINVEKLPPRVTNPMATAKGNPPTKRPKLGFASENQGVSSMDESMKKYQEAMKNCNTKLDAWHLYLPGSEFDVWGFSLKENDDFYWSWKPMILEKAIMKEQEVRLFEKEDTTMDEMLGYVRAANLRATPCGPNISSSFTLKSGKKMEVFILFGLIASPSSESSVKEAMLKFAQQCKNPKIQKAYALTLDQTMKAESIKKDVQEGGPLWEKLISGSGNIVYKRLKCLSHVLCDNKIEEIIRLCYGYGGGLSPSMWDRTVFNLAFGEGDSNETA
jgi:hypothetical protein